MPLVAVTRHKYSRLNPKASACIFVARRLDCVKQCSPSATPLIKPRSLAEKSLSTTKAVDCCLLLYV